jgi:hypothetical protein
MQDTEIIPRLLQNLQAFLQIYAENLSFCEISAD